MVLRPKILIVGLEPAWSGVARLPRALQDANFEVGLLCFKKSYLATTRFRDRLFLWPATHHGGALTGRLQQVVREWHPDFLIAGDELTVVFLSCVYDTLDQRGELARLLEVSLGRPASLLEATSKRRTIETARRMGIRVPDSRWVQDEKDISDFGRHAGFPIVLKQSFGWAGCKVAVCQNQTEAATVLGKWHRNQNWQRRFRRWWNSIRGRVLGTDWLPVDNTITANQFIAGDMALSLAAAYDGRTLAAMTAFREQPCLNDLGPSSVVRFIPNEEMRRVSERLIQAWGLAGLIGFDFIIDAQGKAWLIECNPRPTSISHLGARVGEDLCRALYCGITGQPLPPMAHEDGLVVAHFPQELERDPNSRHLTMAFHDVPTDDPGLFEKLSRRRN